MTKMIMQAARAVIRCVAVPAAMALVAGAAVSAAQSQTIVDQWASVALPPAPALKPVTVDVKTTALLMLDFMN